MKATIEIDDDLYRRLKAAAAMRGRRIKDLVAEAVIMILREEVLPSAPSRISLPLIDCGPPGSLDIPDDVAGRLDLNEDFIRHEASVRQ